MLCDVGRGGLLLDGAGMLLPLNGVGRLLLLDFGLDFGLVFEPTTGLLMGKLCGAKPMDSVVMFVARSGSLELSRELVLSRERVSSGGGESLSVGLSSSSRSCSM